MKAATTWALALAGGDGMRLRLLTMRLAGEPMPKQYCRLLPGRSLLEATLDRVALSIPPERTAVIVNADHARWAAPQIERRGLGEVIVQPRNRDTGPGLALSLLRIARRDPRAVVVVLPSDHWVDEDARFMDHVMEAAAVAGRHPGRIVCLGITPDHPDPDLGYLVPARSRMEGARALAVEGFCEKPEAAEARRLIAAGGLWNVFVMALRVDTGLELLEQLRPEDVRRLGAAVDDQRALEAAYAGQEPWNFSHEVLARAAGRLAVLPVLGVRWSDWGTPEAIGRTLGAAQVAGNFASPAGARSVAAR